MNRPLTPYDTGAVAEPRVWPPFGSRPADWGKVDFENDESSTVATVQVVKGDDGAYRVIVMLADDDTTVEVQ